jgi:hypothetical protein
MKRSDTSFDATAESFEQMLHKQPRYIQVSETVELFSSEPEVSMVRRVFQHAIILTCFALLIAVAAYLGWMVYLETYLEQ